MKRKESNIEIKLLMNVGFMRTWEILVTINSDYKYGVFESR